MTRMADLSWRRAPASWWGGGSGGTPGTRVGEPTEELRGLSLDLRTTGGEINKTRCDLLECWFQLLSISQNSISNYFEKIQISGFPWCSTREDLSNDASITNVGLILTKLRDFSSSAQVEIWISNFFEKK